MRTNFDMYVIFSAAPVVTTSISSYEIIYGNDIILPCSYVSYPAPTSLQWSKDNIPSVPECGVSGRQSGSSVSVPSLTISNAEICDGGTYKCCVVNSQGRTCGSAIIVGGMSKIMLKTKITYIITYI